MTDISNMVLPSALNHSYAPQLLATLRDLSRSQAALDASQVESIDLGSLQILLAAAIEQRAKILNPSKCLRETISALALHNYFESVIAQEVVAITPQSATTEMEAVPMSKRILTIDDSKTMRDMLMLTLSDAGYDVLQAVDGVDGLKVLCREQVDVVITDINMPNMDGYEVIRQVRAKPEYAELPIIVLTTEAEADKRSIAREAGASGWMVKPFDPDRLIEVVQKVAA